MLFERNVHCLRNQIDRRRESQIGLKTKLQRRRKKIIRIRCSPRTRSNRYPRCGIPRGDGKMWRNDKPPGETMHTPRASNRATNQPISQPSHRASADCSLKQSSTRQARRPAVRESITTRTCVTSAASQYTRERKTKRHREWQKKKKTTKKKQQEEERQAEGGGRGQLGRKSEETGCQGEEL